VGGGLAGLAAAVGLARHGLRVTVLEARNRLGGRASSFTDPATGQLVDACQHVSMGCCTNLAHFLRTVGAGHYLAAQPKLYFVTPNRRVSVFKADPWPAPFHLGRALLGAHYLTPCDKLRVAYGLAAMLWANPDADPALLPWLEAHKQNRRTIERFWGVVLTSALNETVDRVGLKYARKVFRDGFVRHRDAFTVHVPTVPLGRLYGAELREWLAAHGVEVRENTGVKRLVLEPAPGTAAVPAGLPSLAVGLPDLSAGRHSGGGRQLGCAQATRAGMLDDSPPSTGGGATSGQDARGPREEVPLPTGRGALHHVELRDGTALSADWYVLAVPFDRVADLLPEDLVAREPYFGNVRNLAPSPITSVHLWYDRPVMNLPHAVLIDCLGQWVFDRGEVAPGEFYLQVVVSAARDLRGLGRDEVQRRIAEELGRLFPQAARAQLLRAKVVTEHTATFSAVPGVDRWRVPQASPVANLAVAGDWTATGWPATMEGAVRSGYRAAEVILERTGRAVQLVQPDL
jgi:predicted NAD/FAD-dependent oxidoreductase